MSQREALISMFQPEPLPVGAGLVAMAAVIGVEIAVLGVIESIPLLFVSGGIAGAITGWLTASVERIDRMEDGVMLGAAHGVTSAGLGGLLVYLLFLTGATGTTVGDIVAAGRGGAYLLFIASPLAVVLFAIEGLVGGAVAGGIRAFVAGG